MATETDFHKLVIEGNDGDQWLLAAPDFMGPGFTFGYYSAGEQRDVVMATTTVLKPGAPRDLSWTQTMVPAVTEQVKDVVDSVTPGAVQWVPLSIEGHPEARYHLMNILHLVDCVDEVRSDGTRASDGSGWSSLMNLRIKSDLEPEWDIFRVRGFTPIIVVTGRLREALAGFRSLRFNSVS